MKKKSNWFWLGIIGALLVVCLIWAGARLSGVSTPLPSFTISPTTSREPVASTTDTPDPTTSVPPTADHTSAPATSETPVSSDPPTPTASETPVVDHTPTPATSETPVADHTPTPATSETPVASDSPAPVESGTPSTSETVTPDPEESEEPFEVIGPIAVIVMGDYVVEAVDLGAITEGYTKEYPSLYGGSNTVEFVPGDARVIEATCPDQVCIGQSWLVESMGGVIPIACLPNSLMIYMVPVNPVETPAVDGMTQ